MHGEAVGTVRMLDAGNRETGTGREYLVISSSSGGEWVLAKGHIEKAETASETFEISGPGGGGDRW